MHCTKCKKKKKRKIIHKAKKHFFFGGGVKLHVICIAKMTKIGARHIWKKKKYPIESPNINICVILRVPNYPGAEYCTLLQNIEPDRLDCKKVHKRETMPWCI